MLVTNDFINTQTLVDFSTQRSVSLCNAELSTVDPKAFYAAKWQLQPAGLHPNHWSSPLFVSSRVEIERQFGPAMIDRLNSAIEQNKKNLQMDVSEFAGLLSNRVASIAD